MITRWIREGKTVAVGRLRIKRYSVSPAQRVQQDGQADEIRRLKAELRRVSEERDILKKAAAYFAKQSG